MIRLRTSVKPFSGHGRLVELDSPVPRLMKRLAGAVPDELWVRLHEEAKRRDRTVSEVATDLLNRALPPDGSSHSTVPVSGA